MTATFWRVKSVRVIGDNAISVRFVDGLEGTVRFQPGFFRGVFSHLTDPTMFRQVSVVDGAVTWSDGLDLAPDAMYIVMIKPGSGPRSSRIWRLKWLKGR